MQKPDIERAISEVMQEEKRFRVRKLKTHVDNSNPDVSLKALDQTWKIDGAYSEKHVHVHTSYEDLQKGLEEILERRKELIKELGISEGDVLEAEFCA